MARVINVGSLYTVEGTVLNANSSLMYIITPTSPIGSLIKLKEVYFHHQVDTRCIAFKNVKKKILLPHSHKC